MIIWLDAAVDWDATIAYRRHLWDLGFGVAEAMDTAQRGMGLDWQGALELIRRSVAAAADHPGAVVFSGCGTDHLAPATALSLTDVIDAYEQQIEAIEGVGGRLILMASRALVAAAGAGYMVVQDWRARGEAAASASSMNELRSRLVPLNRKYPIADVLQACRDYVGDGRRRVTVEYVMLDGVNDSDAQARALARLLRNLPSKINLIPFNPFPAAHYRRSSPERIERFRDILQRSGIVTITRKTRGDDIDAACGQLAGDFRDRTRRRERFAVQVIGGVA